MTIEEFLNRPNLYYARFQNNGSVCTLTWGVELVAYQEYDVDYVAKGGEWLKRGEWHDIVADVSHFRVQAETATKAIVRAMEREQLDEYPRDNEGWDHFRGGDVESVDEDALEPERTYAIQAT